MEKDDAPAMPNEQATGPDEARIAPRTNMFIAAIMQVAGGTCPVRIRNMSRSGALVEAAVLPPPGSAVALVRSVYRVTGKVAWSKGGLCGVKLDSTVTVADWMATPENARQVRVDMMIAEIKGASAAAPIASASVPPPIVDLRGDIDRLHLILDAMGEELTSVPETLMRHAGVLQHLDIAGQMLDALKQAVDPDFGLSRVGLIRLQSLRQSGDEALGIAA